MLFSVVEVGLYFLHWV